MHKDGRVRQTFRPPRCYDHNCRTPEPVLVKITYCQMNPVKRGLGQEPGACPWSSYNWYEGSRDVPIAMDEFESQAV
jgi:hypothetical protein